MEAAKESHLDKLALALCLGGVVLAASIAALGALLNQDFTKIAYGIFVAFELAAFVLGIITRATPLGKAAAITSFMLLAVSILTLA